MEIPFWPTDTSWNSAVLGGETLPGVVTVECEPSWKLDFQKPKGGDGYKVKDEGYEGAPVEITIQLWRREDLEAFAKILPSIRPPKKGGQRKPLEIQHPSAAVAGIQTIAIEKIRIRQPDPKAGWMVEIKAKEWLAAPKANQGLGAAKGGGGQHCAAIAAQLQQAHHKLNEIAVQIQAAQAGGYAGPSLEQAYAKQQNKIFSLQAQLDKCAAGGAVPPPSEAAQEEATEDIFGTDEAALKESLKPKAA